MKDLGPTVRAAVAVIVTGAVLVGCVGQGDRGARTDMNMQQAAERADGMLDATLGAVVPEVQWAHDT